MLSEPRTTNQVEGGNGKPIWVYLNRLGENGVSLETAMALTGHRSVATVMKYYREVLQEELASAVRNIDGPAGRESTVQENSS